MIVVYTPRDQSGILKSGTSVQYKCQADIDLAKRNKEEIQILIDEINRRNEQNYNLN